MKRDSNDGNTTNPCTPYDPPMPNFYEKASRVSEESVIWRHHNSDENGPHSAIGGRNTEPGEFPHMFYNGQKPLDVKIKRIVNHPNFKPPKKYFDIAIVELARSVIFTKYIQPACLWSDFDTTRLGAQATLTGWGVIETAGRKTSPELQAAVVDIIDSGLCDRLLRPSCNRHWCGLESHQICAGKLAGGVDACQGDSGGPLQVKIPLPIISQGSMHYIIGVTSFGIGCARPNLPVIAALDNIPKHSHKMQSIESGRMKRASNNANTTNPCTPYVPPVRNFNKMSKRLSEEKCFEYIWKLKGALGWKAVAGTWIFKCGSTLISEKYLLTAAHCSQIPSSDRTVADTRPKIFYNGHRPMDVRIKRIVNHPNYKPPKKYFDIALVETATNVVFTKFIQPACLWSDFDTKKLGAQATLTGWGVIETAGRKTSPELQAAVVDIIDSGLCDRLLRPSCNRHWCGLESHQICAGKLAGGVDACQGDSGGPLQVKIPLPKTSQGSMHNIIGITSFGIGCARPNLPECLEYISQLQKKDGIDVIRKLSKSLGLQRLEEELRKLGALGWRAVNNGTWIFKCGSTLISENYLLTAAHCSQVAASDKAVADIRPEIVRLGSKNILDPSPNERFIDKKIKRIIKHPTYMSPKKYFDIAIIEISEKVQFTKYIQPACLWSDFDTTRLGKQATVTGWGIKEFRNEAKISVELQAADVDIIDSNTCDRLLQCNRNWCGLKPHQICAGDLTGHVDTCQNCTVV
ncbi:unnamed protein product, partial [Leptidea sinapis]